MEPVVDQEMVHPIQQVLAVGVAILVDRVVDHLVEAGQAVLADLVI
jgi:hypothetical protein